MLNQIVLVGRIAKEIVLNKTEQGKTYAYITLAVPRSYKNVDGKYDTDFIDCTLWEVTAKNTAEYCKVGDIVGIKGRVQADVYEKEGTKNYKLEVIVEKVTFLSSKKHEDDSSNKANE